MKQLSLLKIGLVLISGSAIIAGIYIFNSNSQNNIEKTDTSKNKNIAKMGGVEEVLARTINTLLMFLILLSPKTQT